MTGDIIFKKTCPHCGKEFRSLFENQLNYNFEAHVKACEKKHKKGGSDNENQ